MKVKQKILKIPPQNNDASSSQKISQGKKHFNTSYSTKITCMLQISHADPAESGLEEDNQNHLCLVVPMSCQSILHSLWKSSEKTWLSEDKEIHDHNDGFISFMPGKLWGHISAPHTAVSLGQFTEYWVQEPTRIHTITCDYRLPISFLILKC